MFTNCIGTLIEYIHYNYISCICPKPQTVTTIAKPTNSDMQEPSAVLLSITGFTDIPKPVITWLVDDSEALVSMHDMLLLQKSDIKELCNMNREQFLAYEAWHP